MFQALRDRRRNIYRYWDGKRTRRIDPALVMTRIREHKTFSPEKHLPIMLQPNKFGVEAFDITLKAIQDIFEVHQVDEKGGLTEIEIINLFNHFCGWIDQLKKSISLRPICAPITVSLPEETVTNSNLDCDSMQTGQPFAEPKSSEQELLPA